MAEVHPPSSSAVVDAPEASVDRLLAAGWTRKAAAPTPQPSDDDTVDDAPPKAGRGSSREAWAEYAATVGVDVDDDMTRDDIIEAVEGE